MAKYKVGDYVTAPSKVYLKIVAVIDGKLPVYGVQNPKAEDGDLRWDTEFELDQHKFAPGVPDFARYRKLEAGDILKTGHADDRPYVTILARLGDVVLLSSVPDSKRSKQVVQLADQLKELTDGELNMLDDEEREELRLQASSTYSSKVAVTWKHTDWVCLMNWPVVEE